MPSSSTWTPPAPDAVPALPPSKPNDIHTLSNIQDIYSKHIHIDWSIDWDARIISGSVTHDLIVDTDGVKEVVLDTSYLDIKNVEVEGERVQFKMDERKGTLGSALRIPLKQAEKLKRGDKVVVKVEYSTTPQCTSLGWLTAEQTEAKKAPFLYSQSQPIHGRSLLPCMDSPARKVTYTSSVKSPIPVLMSAHPTHKNPFGTSDEASEQKVKTYTFELELGIPTYLIAIVAGHLSFRELSPRTGVWAEEPMIERAKWEFEADAEKFLTTAEKLVSPYSWTRYDSVVLPPSFPYGGMENCCMTTLTPMLVAGDRSAVDVLAHELMHSWSGNLTTSASWTSFWLNEGWTVYLERLLLNEIHGEQGPAHRGFSYIIGAKALEDALLQFKNQPQFQRLVPVFEDNQDPDDAFSSIPYEKGSNFILHIERTVGGLDVFLPYVKSYFKAFYNRCVTTDEWRQHLYDFYSGSPDITAKLNTIDWDAWLHGEGLELPVKMEYDTTLAEHAYALATRWITVITTPGKAESEKFGASDIKGWNTNQIVVFLEKLHAGPRVPPPIVKLLDDAYGFSSAKNGEILLRFYEVALEAEGGHYARKAAEWVKTMGRMKVCRTIYRALLKVEPELAKKTFLESKSFYHPIAAAMIEKDLGLVA